MTTVPAGRRRGGHVARASSAWRVRLRERGLRATEPRVAILESLETLDHATPEEIFDYVRRQAPSASISSIYRGLEALADCGLVSHTHLSERAPSYQLSDRAAHIHLVCEICGFVTQLDKNLSNEIVSSIQIQRRFAVNLAHLSIFGVCVSCRDVELTRFGGHPDLGR
jgi:Fur family ferric uptake transcriptional regulator